MSELIQQIRDTIGIDDPIKRIAAAGFLSVFTTFGILWVMQILIATGEGAITSKYEGRFVDFVRIKKKMNHSIQNMPNLRSHQSQKNRLLSLNSKWMILTQAWKL